MPKEQGVVVRKPRKQAEDSSVNSLISQAISSNVSVETMEKLFALREKVKAEQAKEAFVVALAEFQRVCPKIEKTKSVMNKDGVSVRYKFAPLDVIGEKIKDALADNGLSYRWEVKNSPGKVEAVCIVTHKLGHSETSSFEIPIDSEGFMTAPQKVASALTFAKRYSLLNALGILTGDEDTDATDVNKEKMPKSDKSKIVFLLRTLGYEAKIKEDVVGITQFLTGLELEEKNYKAIVARLEEEVLERQNEGKAVR